MKSYKTLDFDSYLGSEQIECIMVANDQELDAIIEAIQAAKLERIAKRLRVAGFDARASFVVRATGETVCFQHIMVYNPEMAEPYNAAATLEEAKRLLDTVRNLLPVEAFKRWCPKTDQEFEFDLYTEADAKRDTREARRLLKQQLEEGQIDGKQYAELYRTTSFMDLVKN